MQGSCDRGAQGEGDEVLGVEDGDVGPEGEADQRASDAAERVHEVRAPRRPPPPVHLRDDADPGRDDRREPDVGALDERGEGTSVDRLGDPEEAVDEERRDDVTGECGDDYDAAGCDRERGEADDREAEEGREPGPVGDDAAREQQPEPSVRDRLRARCELRQRDRPRAGADRDEARNRGRSADPRRPHDGRRLPAIGCAATG